MEKLKTGALRLVGLVVWSRWTPLWVKRKFLNYVVKQTARKFAAKYRMKA